MTDLSTIPLRDRARDAEKLVRELSEHVEHTYLSRVRSLQNMISPDAVRPAGDASVRAAAEAILLADRQAEELWQRTRAHLVSLQTDLAEMANS